MVSHAIVSVDNEVTCDVAGLREDRWSFVHVVHSDVGLSVHELLTTVRAEAIASKGALAYLIGP